LSNVTINGLEEDDVVFGTGGNDIINGGDGADRLLGRAGNDTIDGGAGNDIITGGAGADVLTGGSGADQFVYTAVAQGGNVATTGATFFTAGDIITDFVSGTDDLNFATTATGTTVVTASGDQIDLGMVGVVIVNTSFDVTGTTTFADLLAALNTAAGGNSRFDADAGDVTYFAILDQNGDGDADDQYNIFEVTTLFGMGGGTLDDSNSTASLIATLTEPVLVAGDFIL
jgi:Ca2+-binding RTX toxin-like protein